MVNRFTAGKTKLNECISMNLIHKAFVLRAGKLINLSTIYLHLLSFVVKNNQFY